MLFGIMPEVLLAVAPGLRTAVDPAADRRGNNMAENLHRRRVLKFPGAFYVHARYSGMRYGVPTRASPGFRQARTDTCGQATRGILLNTSIGCEL
jgi:hypothetical protein